MKRILLPILIVSIIGLGFSHHKFYVSLNQIDYNENSQALEITMKIFTDDLEYGISGSEDFYGLGTEREPGDADSLIFKYIKKNFKLIADGKAGQMVFVGKEVELDVCWCYVEIENVEPFTELYIANRMLTELYTEQVNIVNVSYGGKTRGLLLDSRKPEGSLSFERE